MPDKDGTVTASEEDAVEQAQPDVNGNDGDEAEETFEETADDGRKKKGFHLSRKIGLVILAAAVLLTSAWLFLFNGLSTVKGLLGGNKTAQTEVSYTRTVTLSKGSLEESVTATGTIASQSTSNVTTKLTYVVKSIPVAVGDVVAAGDTIVTLDTEDLEKQITKQKEKNADSLTALQKAYDDAAYAKTDSYASMASAKTAYESAKAAYDTANTAYQAAVKDVKSYQDACDTARLALETATADLNALNALCWTDATMTTNTQCSVISDDGTTAYTNWNTYLKGTYQSALDAFNKANADLTAVKSSAGYTSAESQYNSTLTAYDQASKTYDNAQKSFGAVNEKYFEAQEALSNGVDNDTLEELETELANCTLKAESAGTVTALNATVGSAASGTVATISDIDSLQITVNVDEYDIQSIQKGMTAVITSDAITQSLTGTVKTVSPVAASTSSAGGSSSTSSSSASFPVTITIDGTTDALLIGMSAQVKIILATTADVYTVPIDAVGKDDSGNSVIYVRNDSGEFEPVIVTTGESNDYYTEVSGSSLKEGMVVRASADASAAAVSTAEATSSETSGAFNFNMGGGGSSGGGGSMPGGSSGGNSGGAPSGGGPGNG